jgi:lipoprotein signal peptidase
MWFEELVGFEEKNPEQVRENLKVVDNRLISKVNNNEFVFGKLEIPSLDELRNQVNIKEYSSQIKLSEVAGNIQTFHKDISNNNSVIQVASQFNLLEMVSPNRVPEEGVGIYEYDATQGPACAVACGAGTIYRNYFANVNGQLGQTSNNQIDCLKDIGFELGNDKYHHWEMKNGYALASRKGLEIVSKQISTKSEKDYEYLKGKLRIGVQWDSEVTISKNRNFITQVYCSALPVAYSDIEAELWSDFAKMVLEAAYEATFYVALKNYEKTKNNKLFLTLIGGGAFGNKYDWIFDAIAKSIKKFSKTPLDVKIVSYGASKPFITNFIDLIMNEVN